MHFLLSYLKNELRRARFAMSNPSIAPDTLRHLRALENDIIVKIEQHPETVAAR